MGKMTKAERTELVRLLRARFKMLRADVTAREAELIAELDEQIDADFAAGQKVFDDAMFELRLAVDEANRKANDIGRRLWGERWPTKTDQDIVRAQPIPNPGVEERRRRKSAGSSEIESRVKKALMELNRQEITLLTELTVGALETAEAKGFFDRLPSVTELVPAYRMREIGGLS